MKGRIKKYIDTKGFGFITGNDNADYFFHVTSVKSAVQPAQGAIVEFVTGTSPKGLTATYVFVEEQKIRPTFVMFGDVRVKLSNIKNYGISVVDDIKNDSVSLTGVDREWFDRAPVVSFGSDLSCKFSCISLFEMLKPPAYWQKIYRRKDKKADYIHDGAFVPINSEAAVKIMMGNGKKLAIISSPVSPDRLEHIELAATKDDVFIGNETALKVKWGTGHCQNDDTGIIVLNDFGGVWVDRSRYTYIFYPDGVRLKEGGMGRYSFSRTDEKIDIEAKYQELELLSRREYFYVTTYQRDNYRFYFGSADFDIHAKIKELDDLLT